MKGAVNVCAELQSRAGLLAVTWPQQTKGPSLEGTLGGLLSFLPDKCHVFKLGMWVRLRPWSAGFAASEYGDVQVVYALHVHASGNLVWFSMVCV